MIPPILTRQEADRLLDIGLAWFDAEGSLLAYHTAYQWDAAGQRYVHPATFQAALTAALAPPPSPEVQAIHEQTRTIMRLAQYGILALVLIGNLPLGAVAVLAYLCWRLGKARAT
jgi:hypothetical protein